MHGQVSPLLEDAHVVLGQWPAGEGVVGPVLGGLRLLRGGRMALEVGEGVAAAVLALERGLLVVPVRQVRVARGVQFAAAVGLDLDALDAGAVVVVVLALDGHVGHSRGGGDGSVALSKKLCAGLD